MVIFFVKRGTGSYKCQIKSKHVPTRTYMKELTIEKCNISVCINNKPCNFNFGQTNKSKCKLKQDENVVSNQTLL